MINLKNPKLKIVAIILALLLFFYISFIFLGGLFLKHKAVAYVDKHYGTSKIASLKVSFVPIKSLLSDWNAYWVIYITYREKPQNAKGELELFKAKNPFNIYEKIEFFGWK